MNFLAVYPLLIDHLAGIDGIKTVQGAAELSKLLNSGKGREISPTEKALYLVFDYARPVSNANNRNQFKMAVGFTAYFVERYYPVTGLNLTATGKVLTQIMKAINGFDPQDEDGKQVLAKPFGLRPPPAAEYNDGFGIFPVSFECELVV